MGSEIRRCYLRDWHVWAINLLGFFAILFVALFVYTWTETHLPSFDGESSFYRVLSTQVHGIANFISFCVVVLYTTFVGPNIIVTLCAIVTRVCKRYGDLDESLGWIAGFLIALAIVCIVGGFIWTSWAYTTDVALLFPNGDLIGLWVQYAFFLVVSGFYYYYSSGMLMEILGVEDI